MSTKIFEGWMELFGLPTWFMPGAVRHTDGRLCFERARLQSCRKRPLRDGFRQFDVKVELLENDSICGGLHERSIVAGDEILKLQ
jgi:hypothetical protein